MWDDCIMNPAFIYIMGALVIAFLVALPSTIFFLAKPVVQSTAENASSGKVVATVIFLVGNVLMVGNVLTVVLPWVDTITDVSFNVEIQKYLDKQTQFNCNMLNQKGMFDSSGFIINQKPYPSASEYTNFMEYIQKILAHFSVVSVQVKIQESKARCLSANLPFLPPDCEYNAAEYACVPASWVRPNQVFR